MDGVTPRHLLCDAVHSAGSQLPLEGTERYNSAQMVKIKVLSRELCHSEMALAMENGGH